MVAGVGNRLMGDDGFGPRVIDLLTNMPLPGGIEVRDVGTAGITIATDLADFDVVIFVDTIDVDRPVGSVSVTRLEVKDSGGDVSELARMTLHEVGLEGLLRFSKAIGTLPERAFLVGCKPSRLDPSLELSSEVEEATERAAKLVLELLGKEM